MIGLERDYRDWGELRAKRHNQGERCVELETF